MKHIKLALALVVLSVLVACGKNEVASNAIAPSSPVIGSWGATSGTTLYFADDSYTYSVGGMKPETGSYTIAGSIITMTRPDGSTVSAQLDGPAGPILFQNESLNKA